MEQQRLFGVEIEESAKERIEQEGDKWIVEDIRGTAEEKANEEEIKEIEKFMKSPDEIIIPLKELDGKKYCNFCNGKDFCPHSDSEEGKAIKKAELDGKSNGCYRVALIEKKKPEEDLRKDMTGKKAVIEIERRSNGEHLVYCSELGFGGECSKDIDGKEQEEIKGFRNALLVRGVKEEDISIHEHTYIYTDDKPELVEKKIKELSAELKKYLNKKYGFEVAIKVEKKQ